MSSPVCLSCGSWSPRVILSRNWFRCPGTIRGYRNLQDGGTVEQKPQIHFPFLEKSDEAKAAEADPNALPLSPIMNKEKWDRRYKRPRKKTPPLLHEMSQQQKELIDNPYARMLAEPVRQDFFYFYRLPRVFYIALTSRINPETNEPWVLPYGIKSSDKGVPPPKPKRYAIAKQDWLEYVSASPKRYSRARHSELGIPREAVWREDFAEFILKQMRRRTVEELTSVKFAIDDASDDQGAWRGKRKVGCVLAWRMHKGDEASTEGKSDTPEAGLPRSLMEVAGREVALYDMNRLLGDGLASELRKTIWLKDDIWRGSLIFHSRTISAHQWLLRLSGYMSRGSTN